MQVTLAKIKRLKPCQSRLGNFVGHYPCFKGTLKQFLALDKITDTDKRWVYFRLLPKKYVAKCATDIAELVLDVYESKYPNDSRPRDAIKAARKGNKKEARSAADAAYAAAYAAYAAAYAAYAADAACAAAYAAYAAAYAAYAADAACAAHSDACAADATCAADAAACAAAYAANVGDAKKAPQIEAEHKIMLKWAKKAERS